MIGLFGKAYARDVFVGRELSLDLGETVYYLTLQVLVGVEALAGKKVTLSRQPK
ncbi:MAG: hypothetical protein L0312_31850 [Acidobacteria bacterium]|nr:hypothetical protein [Acidobacteriota bacterium]